MSRKSKTVAAEGEVRRRGRPRKPDSEVSARTLRRRTMLTPQLVAAHKAKAERQQQSAGGGQTIPGRPTKAVAERVLMLIGSGMTTLEVSQALKISLDVLTARYGDLIDRARVAMKAEAIELMWDLARAGSSPMVRRVIELTSVPQTREAFMGGKKAEEKKPAEPKLGKKQQQALAAANPDPEDPMGALMAQRAARSRMN